MESAGFTSLQEFYFCTKSLTYILMGLGLAGLLGYWIFLNGGGKKR